MSARYPPLRVIPGELAATIEQLPYWFVIGGHAVRCFCPYRPSRDVDFGVKSAANMADLLSQLAARGKVTVLERDKKTAHLRFNDINVSVFVLPEIARFSEERRLSVTGILATKLHAILDRGTRRDFFDLYVTLQNQRIGLVDCLRALREVYSAEVDEGLILRALSLFDDAEREARLPNEGTGDWPQVKRFFTAAVGALIVPPVKALAIQKNEIDVRPETVKRKRRQSKKKARSRKRT